ncbi:ABC transporter substrate-binding protein [Pseudomonas sp. NPDC089743]|uniref:ABC transporter substrate-binding protein n=1 Tax=Pseudomonas sp. NPDC089743 TaxID=3364471 RepID=UPI0038280AA8
MKNRFALTNPLRSLLGAAVLSSASLAMANDKVVLLTSWYAQAKQGGFYQAVADGLYEKQGLDVSIRMGGPQVNGMQLLVSKQADFIVNYDLQILKSVEQGLPVVAVAAPFQGDPQGLMTHADVNGLDGLKNKQVLVSTSGQQEWKTSPLRVMENSFDNSHFSFVHKANFGLFDQPQPASYDFRETDYGFEAETRVPIRNPEESFAITGTRAPITERHLVNRYYLPFSRRFGCMYPDSGIHHIIYNCATPIDDGRLMLVQWLYRNDSETDCPTQALIDWDAAITAEDRDILEATDPDACVDTRRRVELHMPSDKPGLVIRRQLLGLLEAHGESEVFASH